MGDNLRGITRGVTSSHLVRTSTTLADGRELIYFDETPNARRDLVDRRDLPHVDHQSEVRFDALAGEWVAIAGHRQSRTYRPPADACPLCPSTDERMTEIPASSYDVAVFENRFPSFDGAGPSVRGRNLVEPLPGNGRCEVVCFTSNHRATMSSLPESRIRTVLDVWTDRSLALAAHPGVEQVFCFENRGTEIGVTLDHPHGQIYGYPFITPVTRAMLGNLAAHRSAHGENLFGALLGRELAGTRIVAANEHWVAFVPFAARWPIEVHLYPRRQVPDLPALGDDERDAFVTVYREVLQRMEGLYDSPLPAITAWHQAPVREGRDEWWAHLRLFSIRRDVNKVKYLAGSESGLGAFINDSTPESIAGRLKEVSL